MRHFVLSTTLLSTACAMGRDDTRQVVELPVDWEAARVLGDQQELALEPGLLGDLPVVGAFAEPEGYGAIRRNRWYGDQEVVTLEMNALGPNGWAMVQLRMPVVEGDTVEFAWWNGLGCSGPEEGRADFDSEPDWVELSVEPFWIDGEELLEVEYSSGFSGDRTVVGVAVLPAAL